MRKFKKEITAHWTLINTLSNRRFGNSALAEEAALFVLNRLEEGNYRRLKKYSGKSKLSTFIASVSLRLLEDFSRKKFGRIRPPGWLNDLEGYWQILFHLLCLERFRVGDAVETVLSRNLNWSREEIETAAWSILERITSCGKHQGLEVSLVDAGEGVNNGEGFSADVVGPEEQMLADERRAFLSLLFHDTVENEQSIAGAHRFFFGQGMDEIVKNPDDRLLLKLCYKEGLSVSRAGRLLGLNSNQAHGKLRRLLSHIREEFERAGISDEMRGLLQND
ncbi:MAG: hypothetical protein DSY50_01650 [Desulfobulbus sp.]|nr:MAG: hypothetical protein DSY50_01650 [Desulfobulbus sp.]RUM37837.1 MAG: hypothetical protein DSY70_09090 [Desulfobulbus sp.]RUM38716.1 MAG: hypothetical protein DSY58_01760 [Desulfobulbus sp.]